MRLTVGPLPPAVYWRRRVVVLVGIAMVVLIISYACTSSPPARTVADTPSVGGATSNPAPSQSGASAGPSATVLYPVVPTSVPPSPKRTAFTLPTSTATGPCTDAEIEVTASAAVASVPQNQSVEVTIAIENISGRSCERDIGADMQELQLVKAGTIIWSSDDCSPNRGSNVSTFGPGRKVSYTLRWNGLRSRTGTDAKNCTAEAPAPSPDRYQLIARLGQKFSTPFDLHIFAP